MKASSVARSAAVVALVAAGFTAIRRLRGLGITVLAVYLGLSFPVVAYAHATVVSSDPSEGAVVTTLPSQVTITFDENIAEPAFVSVIASDGTNLAEGTPEILDATVTQRVRPSSATGTYTMSYRVVSDDSHPVSGSLSFGVGKGASPPQSTESAASGMHDAAQSGSGSSNTMVYVWIIIGVAVVLIVAAFMFATSGSEPEEPPDQPDP